jgi:hypothetical protein
VRGTRRQRHTSVRTLGHPNEAHRLDVRDAEQLPVQHALHLGVLLGVVARDLAAHSLEDIAVGGPGVGLFQLLPEVVGERAVGDRLVPGVHALLGRLLLITAPGDQYVLARE